MTQALRSAVVVALLSIGVLALNAEGRERKARSRKPLKSGAVRVLAGIIKAAFAHPVAIMPGDAETQVRLILVHELQLIRQVDGLTPEQRTKIKPAILASFLKANADRDEKLAKDPNWDGYVEVRDAVRATLRPTLETTLTLEQMKRYDERCVERAAQRKRAVILLGVARLDVALCLSAEQRERISRQLAADWDDSWEQWVEFGVLCGEHQLGFPETSIVPHLHERQAAQWREATKFSPAESWMFYIGQDEDSKEWWADDPDLPAGPVVDDAG
jgi:hypothetical protein